MNPPSTHLEKAEIVRILRRAGFDEAGVAEIEARLPDIIDLDRDQAVLNRLGIGREELMDRLGGSP